MLESHHFSTDSIKRAPNGANTAEGEFNELKSWREAQLTSLPASCVQTPVGESGHTPNLSIHVDQKIHPPTLNFYCILTGESTAVSQNLRCILQRPHL